MSKKRLEYSKVILFVIAITLGAVITFTMAMVAVTQDLSPLYYIISGLFTLAATAVGFYYWKARAENIIKLRESHGYELTKGIENCDDPAASGLSTDVFVDNGNGDDIAG